MDLFKLQSEIRDQLKQLGFDLIQFTQPPLGESLQKFQQWIEQGYHGEMKYLERRRSERENLQLLLPQVRSVIVLGHGYDNSLENTSHPNEANIARYAWGEDYHQVLLDKLRSFSQWLTDLDSTTQLYFSVDAMPVLEKDWAEKSGLGWRGKHTNVIHPKFGSYFFLAVMLTNIPFEPDPPMQDHCGSCTRCIDICPTQAIVAPYQLDARRCISYLTIELRGPIPREFRPLIGNRIFGCDDCQEVCPWNRFSQPTSEKRFFPREGVRNQPLEKFISITPQEFKTQFSGSAILRAKWKGFIRNVCVAMGNSGEKSFIPLLEDKLSEPEPLIRGHAVWAYVRLLGNEARKRLQKLKQSESDPFVLEEIQSAIP